MASTNTLGSLAPPFRSFVALAVLASLTSGAPANASAAQDTSPDIARRRSPVVRVVERVRPAVVSIQCNVQRDPWGIFNQPLSGTGVVLFEQGYIVTNNHVVAPNNRIADEILVRFDAADDETVYIGEVISRVPEEDLALVKINGTAPFPTVTMSDAEPMLGETVIAIGNAVGETHTVSTGIISGLHREVSIPEHNLHFKSLLQTDAAINLGNSGGPLLDINGLLIGINTVMKANAENVGYAIPAARVRSVLVNLLDPSHARTYLGYVVDENSFRVTSVTAHGPAALAGLEIGDRLVSIDGETIENSESYGLLRLTIQPGAMVALAVDRGGRTKNLKLGSWNAIDGTIHSRLGITVRTTPIGRYGDRYLELASVDPAGPAGRIGLQPGDVIAATQTPRGRAVRPDRAYDLAWLVHDLKKESPLEIEIWRDDDGDGSFERDGSQSELYSGTLQVR